MPSLHDIAVLSILALFILFIFLDIKNKRANQNYPSLLITVGIAFTFLGIAMGLQKFDISNTVDSLPHLINGIKTAFWGSFAGVLGAILLKVFAIFAFKEETVLNQEEAQINKFYQEHSELLNLFKTHYYESAQATNTHIQTNNQILNRIAAQLHTLSTEKTTLELLNHTKNTHIEMQNIHYFLKSFNDQMQKLLMDQHEKISDQIENLFLHQNRNSNSQIIASEKISIELRDFASNQTQQTTQMFNDALKDTLTQLNQGLISHLGENFQEFNHSMGNILTWQKQYTEHVEQQTQHYKTAAQQLHKMQNDFNAFTQQANQFDQIAQNLDVVLSHMHEKSGELDSHLTHFHQALAQKVVDIEQTNQIIQAGFNASKQMVQEFKQNAQHVATDMQSIQAQLHHTFEQTHLQLKQELSVLQEKHNEALNASLLSLARQLGSISEKFAHDYEPITTNIKTMMLQLDKLTPSQHTKPFAAQSAHQHHSAKE